MPAREVYALLEAAQELERRHQYPVAQLSMLVWSLMPKKEDIETPELILDDFMHPFARKPQSAFEDESVLKDIALAFDWLKLPQAEYNRLHDRYGMPKLLAAIATYRGN